MLLPTVVRGGSTMHVGRKQLGAFLPTLGVSVHEVRKARGDLLHGLLLNAAAVQLRRITGRNQP
jgi:hypothetical protein